VTGLADCVRFDDVTLDLQRRRAFRDSAPIPLSRLSFDLLRVLVEEAPRVVTHEELAKRVWGERRVVTPENLAQRVLLLRHGLGDHATHPRYIESMRGIGYRLIPDVYRAAPLAHGGAHAGEPSSVESSPTGPFQHRKKSRWAVGGGVAVVLGGLASAAVLLWSGFQGDLSSRARPIEYEAGESTRLTLESELELDPALSPDGRMIAYAAGPIGQTRIFVRQVAGGTAHNLTPDLAGVQRWPRWSPDGTHVAFLASSPRFDDTIQKVPALGGPASVLVRAPEITGFAWSPGGSELVYAQRWEGIRRQSVTGGEPQLVVKAFEPHSPSWSPDGSHIAFVSGNSLFAFGVQAIANAGPSAVWVVPAAGGPALPVTDSTHLNANPEWAADSRSVFFISTGGGTRDLYQVSLAEPGAPLPTSRRLTTGLNLHSFSREGRSLIYSVFTSRANIWALPTPSDGPYSPETARAVTTGNQAIEGIDASADGWLTFDSNRSGNWDVYKMRPSGGDPIRLTDDPGDDFQPSWSPDGRFVAFHSFRSGNRDIFLVPADGGAQQQLTFSSAQERYPDWSPDGNHIVFHSDATGREELYIISRTIDGWTDPRRLTTGGGAFPKWSPDGRSIAYVTAVTGPDSTLAIVSPDGGQPMTFDLGHEIAASYPAWSWDGQRIFWKARTADGTSSFWSIAATGGSPRELVRFDNLSPSGFDRMEFTVDDSHFYFPLSERESDIWMIELIESAR
jgi:Tol biopolymer transport system component/DNA-binding winged helix-turn-helix (wHTH) protein